MKEVIRFLIKKKQMHQYKILYKQIIIEIIKIYDIIIPFDIVNNRQLNVITLDIKYF